MSVVGIILAWFLISIITAPIIGSMIRGLSRPLDDDSFND